MLYTYVLSKVIFEEKNNFLLIGIHYQFIPLALIINYYINIYFLLQKVLFLVLTYVRISNKLYTNR